MMIDFIIRQTLKQQYNNIQTSPNVLSNDMKLLKLVKELVNTQNKNFCILEQFTYYSFGLF